MFSESADLSEKVRRVAANAEFKMSEIETEAGNVPVSGSLA